MELREAEGTCSEVTEAALASSTSINYSDDANGNSKSVYESKVVRAKAKESRDEAERSYC